ncbi:MAG: transferrin-binding protein-like solute binding protein [OCS116 cluster bacterium]|nr:transferrin-binding protein-like solute binding protein [OCS116 cluster bacterium]
MKQISLRKNKSLKIGLIGFAAISLAACGVTTGGGTTTTGGTTGGGTTTGGTTGGGTTGGSSLFSSKSSYVADAQSGYNHVNLGGTSSILPKDATFKISKNSDGGYDVLSGGKTITFTSADANTSKNSDGLSVTGYVNKTDPLNISTFTLTSDIELKSGQTGYKYSDTYVLSTTKIDISNPTGINTDYKFGAFGENTASMPSSNTVTYNGTAGVSVVDNRDGNLHTSEGALKLVADFATNKVTGSLSALKGNIVSKLSAVTVSNPAGSFAISGDVGSSKFTANLVGDAALNAHFNETMNGVMDGAFFGPAADEIAGGITYDNTNLKGASSFRAKK